MSKTKIEWATHTWNPITGCTPVSEGCQNCYAARMSKRLAGRYGYPEDNPFRVTFHPERLEEPLHWRKPRMVFVCSMGDLFHEDVPFDFICKVWNVMRYARNHTFMLLTKHPKRMLEWFQAVQEWSEYGQGSYMIFGGGKPKSYGGDGIIVGKAKRWPLPNVWLGVTAENQQRADERIPILLQIPAAKRFVSVEPMLGPIDLIQSAGIEITDVGTFGLIDWCIVGGETGPGARPMHPDWARSLRDQCQEAWVPFFFKNWGEWAPNYYGAQEWESDNSMAFHYFDDPPLKVWRCGKKRAGRLLDGQAWDQFPERGDCIETLL